MLTLLATILAAAPPINMSAVPARPSPTPPIQVSLNNDGNFAPGGPVNVRIQTTDDGYLVVFRVDGDGQVRVLFPLDPDGDAFVRGGKRYELRGRGAQSTFLADSRGGSGMVYAAIAPQPLVFSEFSVNGHWDYSALRLGDSTTDAENDLSAIVTRMTSQAPFEYDAVGYRVQEIATTVAEGGNGYYPGLYDPYYNPSWRCLSCGWGYSGTDIVGFGYSPFWDPWLYSPWDYGYARGYGYGLGYGYGYPGSYWYPVAVNPRPERVFPPGTRSRPRAIAPTEGSGSHVTASPPAPTRANIPGSASVGTRARPRPADMSTSVTRRSPVSERPVFRQPAPNSGASRPSPVSARPVFRQPLTTSGSAARPQESRPVYRQPPEVYRAPPQPSRAPMSPPPQASSPAPRSAPPVQRAPPAPARSRPGGGGRRP